MATPNLPTSCFRGWRKKRSKIRADAENRARAVIREEFQNLGPIKCVAWVSLGWGESWASDAGELPSGLTPASSGSESQGNFKTRNGILEMEGREVAYTDSLKTRKPLGMGTCHLPI